MRGEAALAVALLFGLGAACARSTARDDLPARPPDVAGMITYVGRSPAGSVGIFIEANPSDAPVIGSGSPKANVAIGDATRVLRLVAPGEHASATLSDLRLGDVVSVWYADSARAVGVAGRARAPAAVIVIQPPRRR